MTSGVAPEGATPAIAVQGITKRFGGQVALVDVALEILPGTVHALVGENGAGKSTLGKILAGVHRPDDGTMNVNGRSVTYRSPAQALKDGISFIAQEIALAEDLTVAENVMLGHEADRVLLSKPRLREEFQALCERTGLAPSADARVADLRLAEKQEVEILRALARRASVIVMDEPTAALTPSEIEKVHALVRRLRDDGVTVVYVSHFLDEVLALADTITVMRSGRCVETLPAKDTTVDRLVEGMLGDKLTDVFPPRRPASGDAPVALRLRGFEVRPGRPIDLDVRNGEIVGVFGLVGSGRSALAHVLGGAGRPHAGVMELDGAAVDFSRPRDAIDGGLVLLPESRRDQGLFMQLSQLANATAATLSDHTSAGVVRRARQRHAAKAMLERLAVDPLRLAGDVGALSGGNQQKVLFAKCLLAKPRVLVLDEPTRGVDIGAKHGIYTLIADLLSDDMGIVLISSEIDEITNLSHRVVVMREGAVAAHFTGPEISEQSLLRAAFGIRDDQAVPTES